MIGRIMSQGLLYSFSPGPYNNGKLEFPCGLKAPITEVEDTKPRLHRKLEFIKIDGDVDGQFLRIQLWVQVALRGLPKWKKYVIVFKIASIFSKLGASVASACDACEIEEMTDLAS